MTSQDHAPVHAIILAAGEGSRLRPLTDHVPKPMLPIDGRAVVLRVLDQLARVGITDAAVVIGYLGSILQAFLAGRADAPRLTFVEQPAQQGSAHALQCALDAGIPRVATVVVASDIAWHDVDVSRVVDHAAADSDAIVTVAVQRWPVAQVPHHYETVVDDQQRVTTMLSKCAVEDHAYDATALSGSALYVSRPDFWKYVAAVAPSSNGKVELA
ncbi:MAG: nucleotidyltransferase family protein, partial [Thermoleophilia bacterium]|nr:nucleotidyltransferase family protein [Thermoleophilia bacterium]